MDVIHNKVKMGNCKSVAQHPKKKKRIPASLKKATWDTWIGASIGEVKCPCCKHQHIRQLEFHCGHVIAEAFGGQTNVQNLRPICAQCNLSMGTMNMLEFQKKFFNQPSKN